MTNSCLLCKHVAIEKPFDWKPSYPGQAFDAYAVRSILREKGLPPVLRCTFNPKWIQVSEQHYCGRWAESSWSGGHESLATFIWGTWAQRENEKLVEKVKTLKGQLERAKSRKLSVKPKLSANGKSPEP